VNSKALPLLKLRVPFNCSCLAIKVEWLELTADYYQSDAARRSSALELRTFLCLDFRVQVRKEKEIPSRTWFRITIQVWGKPRLILVCSTGILMILTDRRPTRSTGHWISDHSTLCCEQSLKSKKRSPGQKKIGKQVPLPELGMRVKELVDISRTNSTPPPNQPVKSLVGVWCMHSQQC
jgi:hypothetical protein